MKLLRIQGEVPDPYVEQSRDFQTLCRAYDCVVNSVKFDVDSIAKITDTGEVRSNLLPLLQTKLGFFTSAEIDSDALRLILSVFPELIKRKGSLKAVRGAVNVFLKISRVRVPITITITKEPMPLYNVTVPDHTVVIGISSAFKDTSVIFQELLRYILPAGFGYYTYFYSSIDKVTSLLEDERVAVLYISDTLNSLLASASDYASEGTPSTADKRLTSATSLMEVFSKRDFPLDEETQETEGADNE